MPAEAASQATYTKPSGRPPPSRSCVNGADSAVSVVKATEVSASAVAIVHPRVFASVTAMPVSGCA